MNTEVQLKYLREELEYWHTEAIRWRWLSLAAVSAVGVCLVLLIGGVL